MPLPAGDIIDAARDRHPAFSVKQTPDASALRFLSSYARDLHGKVVAIDTDLLREEVTIPFPLADFDAGIELPANRQVIELVGATAAYPSGTPIDLIPARTRNDLNAPRAAAWQIGDRLFLRGDASSWDTLTGVAIAYLPMPPALLTRRAEVPLPDSAAHTLEANVALFMALRGPMPGTPPVMIDTRGFGSVAAEAERTFLEDVVNGMGGKTFRTRDVMGY